MASYKGLKTIADLRQIEHASIADIGFDQVFDVVQKDLDNYNKETAEMMADFANPVSNQTKVFNYGDNTQFQEADELSVAEGQVSTGSFEVSFPLYKYIYGLGWTMDYMNMKSPADLADSYDRMLTADKKNIVKMLRKGIYCGSANASFVDKWTNGATLTIKGFWNNDGVSDPPANSLGTTFAAHDHYIIPTGGQATLAVADIDGAFSSILEHDLGENLAMFVHYTDVAVLAGLANTKFEALPSALKTYRVTDTPTETYNRNGSNSFNYMAGLWDGKYEVWVKPWTVDGYYAILDVGQESYGKALGVREPNFASMKGLKLQNQTGGNPIITQEAIRFMGVAVQNRFCGFLIDNVNAVYTNPTL